MSILKDWRKRHGITQAEAAKRAEVSQGTWCDWENELVEPRIHHALKIQEITGGEVPLTALARKAKSTVQVDSGAP